MPARSPLQPDRVHRRRWFMQTRRRGDLGRAYEVPFFSADFTNGLWQSVTYLPSSSAKRGSPGFTIWAYSSFALSSGFSGRNTCSAARLKSMYPRGFFLAVRRDTSRPREYGPLDAVPPAARCVGLEFGCFQHSQILWSRGWGSRC